MKQYNKPSKS